ncbi:CBS domain-containing protein [Lederbergia citri]|uniref:CBS domain-containing protein n=1 Tax=Lederbergia citri TaxID=2833580 RepID=A0A942YJM7_9BACI|nr:CBS domain-containing protein [Lederbergia citri]MBS4197720.1 CBS domain-containing protein [Lederbergia citri]
MKVKDFMINNVYIINENDSVKNAIKQFIEHHIGGMPVVNDNGILTGMITDGDVLRFIKPKNIFAFDYYSSLTYVFDKEKLEEIVMCLKDVPVQQIAKSRSIVKVFEDDDLEVVLELLAKHHFKKVPVVDKENKVIGVISRGDLIRTIQETLIENL